jgi:hypothetical protein
VPTITGPPRDFTASDAELQLLPRSVTLNGTVQQPVPVRLFQGRLLWLYLPGHGRYVLSLAPRPGLDFKPAGESRGAVITFTAGPDTIVLQSGRPIAPGDAAYHLYVLHDESWQPTADSQKTRLAVGTVNPRELSALQ